MSIWIFFRLIGALALLMFGMKTMSDSLQKMAGPQLRHVLGTMTTNRLTGILSGMLITAAVQSSTATTVMTVSFVNAGLLTLAQAISVIMGANIGTTLTAWIMSAGFSFNITDFVWPAFFIAIILIYSKKRKIIGDFIFGISFMFLGLGTLRQTGIDMDLAHNQPVLEFFASFDPHSFQTTITFLIIGSILTMCVQSSAAVMAITMILCSTGVLPIYQGIALVMGENIGTTVTSNVAALTANTQARRAAMAHMVFNIFGVLWILCVFRPFIHLVCGWVGYDDMMEKTDPHFVEYKYVQRACQFIDDVVNDRFDLHTLSDVQFEHLYTHFVEKHQYNTLLSKIKSYRGDSIMSRTFYVLPKYFTFMPRVYYYLSEMTSDEAYAKLSDVIEIAKTITLLSKSDAEQVFQGKIKQVADERKIINELSE